MDTQSIVILDFGAQYTQLIARRIREQNVFSAVLPCTVSLEEIQAYKPIGIVLSGGPCSVYDADAPPADPKVLGLGVPILGICYGLQFITHHLGGKVRAADKREYGHADAYATASRDGLARPLIDTLAVMAMIAGAAGVESQPDPLAIGPRLWSRGTIVFRGPSHLRRSRDRGANARGCG